MITLDEAKSVLRVDFSDDDAYITQLISASEKLVRDVARLSDDEFVQNEDVVRAAAYYTISYLYEHREDADMHELTMMMRSILFGIRKAVF